MSATMNTIRPMQRPAAGSSPETHRVSLSRGESTTTFVVGPAFAIAAISAFLALFIGITGATAFWTWRDEVLISAVDDRSQIEVLYQDRIDRLRAEIERLNSRQIVDRHSVELQVAELLRRQEDLNKRHNIVSELMDRAERSGIRLAIRSPIPSEKPDPARTTLAINGQEDETAIGGESEPLVGDPLAALGLRGSTPAPGTDRPVIVDVPELTPDKRAALHDVETSLVTMRQESTAALDALAVAAESKIDTILDATKPLGISLASAADLKHDGFTGGPFVPVTGQSFQDRVLRADRAMRALDDVESAAKRLPISRPMKNTSISSHFGPRLDPFLKSLAMHTGMDFKASYGSRIYATAAGTVIHAGWKGGYGKMVEIQHANGFVTRYAHMSRVQVAEGNHVILGDVIGNIGSTGRSTGPHLHYEVRLNDRALDPAAFVTAGDRLTPVLFH